MSGEGRHYELLCEAHREYMMRLCEAERERDEARAWAKRWEQCERDLEKRAEQAERERDEARAEVEHLRRGVETYQRMLWETTETPGSTERKMLYAEEMLVWEREDAERRESGDDQAAGTRL